MDPHANIVEAVSLAHEIVAAGHANPDDLEDPLTSSHLRLAELVTAQHDWRMKGGFDPYLPPDALVADPQANALLERVKRSLSFGDRHVRVYGPAVASLPDDYLYVVEQQGDRVTFDCGIASDGSVSS